MCWSNQAQCSVGSWGLHLTGHDSQSLHHTPTNSGWGSVRWHSGTHWVHTSDILQRETAPQWRREWNKRPISNKRSLTTLLWLIWAIAAVVVMVTHKVLGDALSVLAHELVAAARVVEHWDIKKYVESEWGKNYYRATGAVWIHAFFCELLNIFKPQPALTTASFDALVSPVRTVFVSIALPKLRDTHMWSRTLECLWTAGFGLCKGKGVTDNDFNAFFFVLHGLFVNIL